MTNIPSTASKSPYDDQPLGPGEIRLLTVSWGEEASLRHVFPWLELDAVPYLTTEVHKLEDEPEYYALSYVWGTAPASISVPCNGTSLLITPSAYEILQVALRADQTLWIDAICIDQEDPAEKELQIPLMQQIYANATNVVMYLGQSNLATHAFMCDFSRVLQLSYSWQPTLCINEPDWRGPEWPREDELFWEGFWTLLNHDWFRRVWTYQEIVLAKHALLVCGDRWINANKFIYFVSEGQSRKDPYIAVNRSITARLPGNPSSAQLAHSACCGINICWQDPPLYEKEMWETQFHLPQLLFRTQTLNVKEPVDRVWGLAGLMSEVIQKGLAPVVDYSEEGRREYWRTYHQFARVTLVEAQTFALLALTGILGRKGDRLPSWCPDLSGKLLALLHVEFAWHMPVTHTYAPFASYMRFEDDHEEKAKARVYAIIEHPLKNIATEDNDRVLCTRGFVVDTIIEVIEDEQFIGKTDFPINSTWIEWNTYDPFFADFVRFYIRVWDLARKLAHTDDPAEIPMNFIMCVLTDWRVTTEAQQVFRDAWACMNGGNKEHYMSLPEERRWSAWEALRLLIRLMGHSFFATASGKLGISTPGCKIGDKVCCFYGGLQLYNLRFSEEESPNAEFSGTAFVPYLMTQDERDNARQGEDVVFRIA